MLGIKKFKTSIFYYFFPNRVRNICRKFWKALIESIGFFEIPERPKMSSSTVKMLIMDQTRLDLTDDIKNGGGERSS